MPRLYVPQFPHLFLRGQTKPFWFWHPLISERMQVKHPESQSWKQDMDTRYLSFLGDPVGKAFSLQDHASDAHCNLSWGDSAHRSIAWLDEGWSGGGGDAAKVMVVFHGPSVPLSGPGAHVKYHLLRMRDESPHPQRITSCQCLPPDVGSLNLILRISVKQDLYQGKMWDRQRLTLLE